MIEFFASAATRDDHYDDDDDDGWVVMVVVVVNRRHQLHCMQNCRRGTCTKDGLYVKHKHCRVINNTYEDVRCPVSDRRGDGKSQGEGKVKKMPPSAHQYAPFHPLPSRLHTSRLVMLSSSSRTFQKLSIFITHNLHFSITIVQ